MMNIINKLDDKLRGMHPLSFLIVMGIVIYIPLILTLPLYLLFPEGYIIEVPREESHLLDIILYCLVCPYIETLIFQFGVITLLRKLFNFRNTVLIIISALIFGVVHSPFVTQIMAFFSGLLFSYTYIVYENNRNIPAILMVTIVHIIRNIPIAFPL